MHDREVGVGEGISDLGINMGDSKEKVWWKWAWRSQRENKISDNDWENGFVASWIEDR